jgi:hypothetical protein
LGQGQSWRKKRCQERKTDIRAFLAWANYEAMPDSIVSTAPGAAHEVSGFLCVTFAYFVRGSHAFVI